MKEQERLIREMAAARPVRFLAGSYEPEEFFSIARGHEKDPEGGERCHRCYELRLRPRRERRPRQETLIISPTTLSISPLKNARWLNDIGCRLAGEYGIPYLVSDFKKRNGYKRSVELSALYGLYRQDYCGCVYSRAEAIEKQKAAAGSVCSSRTNEHAWSGMMPELFSDIKIVKKLLRIFPINLT